MNIRTVSGKLFVLLLVACAFTQIALAQEPEPSTQQPAPSGPPKPAARGIPGLPGQGDDQVAPSDWTPDTMPLTGLQTSSVGNANYRHSYIVPGLQYAGTFQDQPSGASSSDWYSNHYLGGNLSLVKSWGRSQLALNESGGGFVTTQSGSASQGGNGWFEQFGAIQSFLWKRWQMQILDQFSYSPVSQFGFGGGTGLGAPGISGSLGPSVPGVGGSSAPNQSIYAAAGPRYSNSFASQLTYEIGPRGSVTFVGSYGLLHFSEAGNVDTDSYLGGMGYNYELTKNDSIGLFYRFSAIHFRGQPQALGDHAFNFAYGRKITKRLGLQLNAGPMVTFYRVPVGNQTQVVSANGGASLSYAFEKGGVSVNYYHGLTGGSGILIGANTDQVTFSARRSLTRVWTVQGNVGYASNRPLESQTGIRGNNYGSIFAGGGLDRPIGRNLNLSFAYTAEIQQQNATTCTVSPCSSSHTQNIVIVNLQWHTRPFVIE